LAFRFRPVFKVVSELHNTTIPALQQVIVI
jgi:hypothetical protein